MNFLTIHPDFKSLIIDPNILCQPQSIIQDDAHLQGVYLAMHLQDFDRFKHVVVGIKMLIELDLHTAQFLQQS